MNRWLHPSRVSKIPISYADYPVGYLYPPWCHGGAVGMRKEIASRLLEIRALAGHNEFYVDDVLFYGIYRELAGISQFYSHRRSTCAHWTSVNETQKIEKLNALFKERTKERTTLNNLRKTTSHRMSHHEIIHRQNRVKKRLKGISPFGSKLNNWSMHWIFIPKIIPGLRLG